MNSGAFHLLSSCRDSVQISDQGVWKLTHGQLLASLSLLFQRVNTLTAVSGSAWCLYDLTSPRVPTQVNKEPPKGLRSDVHPGVIVTV